MTAEPKTVVIDHLGAQGDGVVAVERLGDKPMFVAGALPGETVRVMPTAHDDRFRLDAIEIASAERRVAICPHFGVCGGCTMQHLERARYRDWKQTLVGNAFAARGLTPDIASVIATSPGQRRRATFVAQRLAVGDAFGFHEAYSHSIVDIGVCPVLVPEIVSAFGALRVLAAAFLDLRPHDVVRLAVTAADNGLDIAITAADADPLTRTELREFTHIAADAPAVRVSYADEAIALRAAPIVTVGPAAVVLPTSAFLQAVASAEHRMAELILAALPKRCKNVADLFCGLGAFTFPLATRARVTAVDGDNAIIMALAQAASHAKGIKPVTPLARDLFQMPLSRSELATFDAVVFDPPRAGAKAQAEALAKSKVPTVIAVSCNPATLARDARTLVDGGYSLQQVTPIDQFLFSSHVECVAVFSR